MAEKTRKKKSTATRSRGGTSRKKRTLDAGDSSADASMEEKVTKPMAQRIGKSVEDRLAKLETKIDKRTRSQKRPSVSEAREPEDDSFEEDSDVPVKKIRRSSASDLSESSIESDGKKKWGILGDILSLIPGSKARDYDDLIDTLEHMDEFGKVPDVDNRLEALMTFLYKRYWRVETMGLENIPDEGRTLIVSNHSGVLPFDGAMMGTAIYKFHPARRYARFLIEDWFGQLPFATGFMNAVGQVRACQENAERLLRQEQLVGVFPEGIKGMAKGFKNRYNVARFGRGGVIRLAIRTRSPVVPCAVVGAEEIYIVLGYANWLGKMLGMPLLPITPTFPWLGPLGVIPLPTKWYIQFGKIIRYDKYDESALKDNVIINRLNRQLRATVQEMLDSLLKKRRSLFFG